MVMDSVYSGLLRALPGAPGGQGTTFGGGTVGGMRLIRRYRERREAERLVRLLAALDGARPERRRPAGGASLGAARVSVGMRTA
jgi:hypothetical protein